MESRGRGDGGDGARAEEETASASAGETDGDDAAPAPTSTPAPSPPTPPAPPCYTVVSTPYTGEPAARGLVANRGIRRGEVIETAHCVVIENYPEEGEGEGERERGGEKDAAAAAASAPAKTTAMGLEHYVFFDRRGRSSCSPAPVSSSSGLGGERKSTGGDGGGGGDEEEKAPPQPAAALRVLLALGVGSLFNHSRAPNVDWRAGTAESSASPLVEREGGRARSWRGGGGGGDSVPPPPPPPRWPVISFIAARDIEPGE